MRIGELSARSGVSARSLRYYEHQGLVAPTRAMNGYREYAESDVTVVHVIRTMYEIGFAREAVRAVLPCVTGQSGQVDTADIRSRVQSMCEDLGARIDDLQRTRAMLVDFLDGVASEDCSDPEVDPASSGYAK